MVSTCKLSNAKLCCPFLFTFFWKKLNHFFFKVWTLESKTEIFCDPPHPTNVLPIPGGNCWVLLEYAGPRWFSVLLRTSVHIDWCFCFTWCVRLFVLVTHVTKQQQTTLFAFSKYWRLEWVLSTFYKLAGLNPPKRVLSPVWRPRVQSEGVGGATLPLKARAQEASWPGTPGVAGSCLTPVSASSLFTEPSPLCGVVFSSSLLGVLFVGFRTHLDNAACSRRRCP